MTILRTGEHYLLRDPLEDTPVLTRWDGQFFVYGESVRYAPAPGQRWVSVEALWSSVRGPDPEEDL